MNKDEIAEAVSTWLSHVGRKGGLIRSQRKREAARKNAELARKTRAEKRKKGLGK